MTKLYEDDMGSSQLLCLYIVVLEELPTQDLFTGWTPKPIMFIFYVLSPLINEISKGNLRVRGMFDKFKTKYFPYQQS